LDPSVALASLSATAKLLSAIGLGGAAARTPGVLDADAISALSRLVYWIFQPAFLLCSVSKTIAGAGASGGLPGRFLALMPLAALLQISLGAISGKILTNVVGFQPKEAQDVQMCTTFANSGPLPLIYSEALFGGSTLQGEVASCISFYLLVWSPLFWSFGKVIMGTYGNTNEDNTSRAKKIVNEVRKVLSPPVIGSILGVVVGSVPFLRNSFMGGWASPFFGALANLGTAYLPAAVLVLAGSLFVGGGGKSGKEVNEPDTTATPSVKAIVSIFASRFMLSPLIAIALLHFLENVGLLGPAGTRARAVVSFVLLMEGCTPPAQNSVILLQLAGLKERASGMAKLLTILYSLAVIPVTVLLTVSLGRTGIMAFR
jgi:predicted permease